jgi:(1->4)-alpha-D-glucan 1-alpha-D-glucosylmutase
VRRERWGSLRGRGPTRGKRGVGEGGATLPRATYRVQLNHKFRFRDAEDVIGYLNRLGISHFYSSPLLRAKSGSLHCYDVVRHDELNPEIGSIEEFDSFAHHLSREGMGLLLDIVPNHMCAGEENPLWMDVLEHGPFSAHAEYFDIRWPKDGKVVLPILADEYDRVLESGDLQVEYEPEAGTFSLLVSRGSRVPLNPRSYADILELARGSENRVPTPAADELEGLIEGFGAMPSVEMSLSVGRMGLRLLAEGLALRRRLGSLLRRDSRMRALTVAALQQINGKRGGALLDSILARQFYRLTYWRNAAGEINYRRFLNLSEYVAIRAEDPAVFRESHGLVMDLVSSGAVTGIRVDHPDGLWDPARYFRRLASSAARATHPTSEKERAKKNRSFYIVAEKVLCKGERLAKDWGIHGTTGYDFLNLVNGLFVSTGSAEEFEEIYSQFTGDTLSFEEVSHATRMRAIEASMLADVRYLALLLSDVSKGDPRYRGLSLGALEEALAEVAACLPVYRTYASPRRSHLTKSESRYVEAAISAAKTMSGGEATDPRALDLVRETLTEPPVGRKKQESLAFLMRFQQFTPSVMVKGVEDTAFYEYNRLSSLNEVGGEPGEFGVSMGLFHSANALRARDWPLSMLATSTHDTKRSEDVRARINVLSEMPSEWRSALLRWSHLNSDKKGTVEGEPAPSRGDEYLLYQTLLGGWPSDRSDLPGFTERIVAYMLKATKEAKQHTSWLYPRQRYDEALSDFVRSILRQGENPFLADFLLLEERVASFGMLNSLSQLLLKLTVPGVPDIYQGTELWDYSLVDPDNRRQVDFSRRSAMLDELHRGEEAAGVEGLAGFASKLMTHPDDGRVKMYVLSRTLAYRRRHPGLFTRGGYAPVECVGPKRLHICAFSRTGRGESALVIAPRFFAVLGAKRWPLADPQQVWSGTMLRIGKGLPSKYRDLFTGEQVETTLEGNDRWINLDETLKRFPVVLLQSTPQ